MIVLKTNRELALMKEACEISAEARKYALESGETEPLFSLAASSCQRASSL